MPVLGQQVNELSMDRVTTSNDKMTEYELFVTAPHEGGKPLWINANQRQHWAVKAKNTKLWRQATALRARQMKLPTGLKRAHITVHVHKSNRRTYDVHNLYGTAKAAIDGLIDYGVLPDDTNAHLTGPDMREGDPRPIAGITITIKETT
ncbi:hypothetical protein QDX25_04995 [Auritidibacter ignavus]|uniref:hypothetical protein n=1 Tax=Auritidibacter ignavus TaxID=678932 RepID=UPI0011C44804|nr:hypothetical protein [Auritidibacter ignavus]WGH82510.1 hypothetical protein QDX25_04995 [Auritidibacter ignavus]WHS27559.1 hypothetical protein QM395_09270 [Auritidibacter ignavus]